MKEDLFCEKELVTVQKGLKNNNAMGADSRGRASAFLSVGRGQEGVHLWIVNEPGLSIMGKQWWF